jgi:hypothetical protein
MSTKHKRVSLFYQNINREGKQFYSIATCSASPVAVAGKERKKEGEREREISLLLFSHFACRLVSKLGCQYVMIKL